MSLFTQKQTPALEDQIKIYKDTRFDDNANLMVVLGPGKYNEERLKILNVSPTSDAMNTTYGIRVGPKTTAKIFTGPEFDGEEFNISSANKENFVKYQNLKNFRSIIVVPRIIKTKIIEEVSNTFGI